MEEEQVKNGFSDKDKENGADKKLEKWEADENSGGLKKRSGCTDLLFLALFVAAMAIMTVLGTKAAGDANVQALTSPLDYKGRICGVDPGVAAKPYGFVISSDASVVCVKKCPDNLNTTDLAMKFVRNDKYDSSDYDGFDSKPLVCKGESKEGKIQSLVGSKYYGTYEFAYKSSCMIKYETYGVLGYCIPIQTKFDFGDDFGTISISSILGLSDYTGYMQEFIGDIWTARNYIFGFGFAIALAVSFGFCYILRLPGLLWTVVWTMVIMCGMLFLLIASLAYTTYKDWNTQDPQEREDYEIKAMMVMSYIFFGCAAAWYCVMFCMRARINLAIAITKVTARAVTNLKTVVFVPVLLLACFLVFMTMWMLYALLMLSSGEYTEKEYFDDELNTTSVTQTWEFHETSTREKYFLIFCYFWVANFLVAAGQLIIAMCFAIWYFTRDKSKVGVMTVNKAIGMTIRYHMGTVACGSLIIAIIQFVRYLVSELQRKAKKTRFAKLASCILCCIQCCLWCIEKCMKFINKNAYIQTAIYGTSFCTSAKNAFFLICRNILRIAAVNIVSGLVTVVGKFFIMVVTTSLAYMYMYNTIADELASLVGPTVFVAVFAYFIALIFMAVFSMGIDTLLQCFIADEEMNPNHIDRYATPDLKKFIDGSGGREKRNSTGAISEENKKRESVREAALPHDSTVDDVAVPSDI